MKRSLLLCISFIVFLTAPLLHAAEAAEPSGQGTSQQEILILNSYHPGFAWSDDEQAGIIDVFRAKDKNWLPVIEYLDLKRLPDGRHLAELKKLFRRKYQNEKFSVVIAIDNPALEFATDNQAELFRNAPIVFYGINNYTPSLLKGRSEVTGIVEAIDLAGTIEVMLRLHPATHEIFVLHDYTVTGLAAPKAIEALIPRFGAKVRFRFTDPMTMEELLKELERLPGDSLVLPISFITDKSGRTFGVTETTKLFYEHSPVPIYSTFEQRLGFGIVGGKLLNARIHGANAGRIALRVLAGEKASAIPVVFESDAQFMFDYKVMSRFGIPLSALPEGSTVINKPVSFYAAHRVVIQAALVVIGFMVVVIALLTINIIQRRRSDIALRASEESLSFKQAQLQAILDYSPTLISVKDLIGNVILANRNFVVLDVPPLHEFVGKNVFDLFPRDVAENLWNNDLAALKAGGPVESEEIVKHKDGSWHTYLTVKFPVYKEPGQPFGICAISTDITERKEMEKALRASQQIIEGIINAIPVRVFWKDKNLVFLGCNAVFARDAGFADPKDIIGKDDYQMVWRDQAELYRGDDLQVIESGCSKVFIEEPQKTPEGNTITLLTSKVPLRSSKGEISGVLGTYMDITDRKQAEEALRASREQLRALAGRLQAVREEERTQIAREIHDELGGALTGMKIDFSLLTRAALKIENETVRASLLAGMDSMIKFTDATIQTVRRIAMELRPGVLDDLGLVAALEWQLKDFEKRTGIRCEFFPPGKDISLDADLSTALFRIFQEALTNVARHSGATEVHVRLHADADSSTLEVEDNGKGIEKEKVLSSKSLGFLGMRERAQMFGGRITVTGTPGRGTIVTVEIPPEEKRKMDRDQEGAAG